MISTGRGGAGNIVHSDLVGIETSVSHSSQTNDKEKKVYYSTGRGGAGNIKSSKEIPSPKLVPQGSGVPALTTHKFTTGRGGYGNMVSNDNPELTRKLQDVDNSPSPNELQAVASNRSFAVGRGGFGNVISNTRSNGSSHGSNSNNLYAVVSNGEKRKKDVGKKDDHKKGGFMSKVKSIFS